MKYQALNLVASTPLIVGFAPSASTIWQHRINAINCQDVIYPAYNGCIPFTSTRTPTNIRVSLPFFSPQFRTAALLARPKANLEEEGDDDSDFEDEDAEDEEEEDGEQINSCQKEMLSVDVMLLLQILSMKSMNLILFVYSFRI